MPWIDHPARQGERVNILDWLRYYVGIWMQRKGSDLEYRALYPHHVHCSECGQWILPNEECDHIPF